MKTLDQILDEIYQPVSDGNNEFLKKHKILVFDYPIKQKQAGMPFRDTRIKGPGVTKARPDNDKNYGLPGEGKPPTKVTNLRREEVEQLDELLPLPTKKGEDGKYVEFDGYHIVTKDGKKVGHATTKVGARKAIDRHDNNYGSYHHRAVGYYKDKPTSESLEEVSSELQAKAHKDLQDHHWKMAVAHNEAAVKIYKDTNFSKNETPESKVARRDHYKAMNKHKEAYDAHGKAANSWEVNGRGASYAADAHSKGAEATNLSNKAGLKLAEEEVPQATTFSEVSKQNAKAYMARRKETLEEGKILKSVMRTIIDPSIAQRDIEQESIIRSVKSPQGSKNTQRRLRAQDRIHRYSGKAVNEEMEVSEFQMIEAINDVVENDSVIELELNDSQTVEINKSVAEQIIKLHNEAEDKDLFLQDLVQSKETFTKMTEVSE